MLVRIDIFNAFDTTDGAKYNPSKNILLALSEGPTCFPSPGSVSLSAHKLTKSSFPTIYAPFVDIPAPKFLISEPTHISASTLHGVVVSTNSQ